MAKKTAPRSGVGQHSLAKTVCVLLFCATVATESPAQTFSALLNFDGSNGAVPGYGSLIQGTDGNFYGTTTGGGAHSAGTVFRITAAGMLTTLYSFCSRINHDGYCTDGETPSAGLVQDIDGNFYGTTTYGGAKSFGSYKSNGTIFRITPSGSLTTLYSFCAEANCADGQYPDAGLVQGTDGDFYGTTSQGGASSACNYGNNIGCGTVFRITTTGHLTTLHSFASTDGAYPYSGLIQATNGNYYGTTSYGTIYRITPCGTLTTLAHLSALYGELVQATDGNFYGTTHTGGAKGFGSVFKITASRVLTTLYSFCEPWPTCTDGSWPWAGPVQATDGNFYGTTTSGGAYYSGTIFTITAAGSLTTLHSFDETDGKAPLGGLLQSTDGNFYGTTSGYGAYYDGTIFRLSMALDPFVSFVRNSGRVGQRAGILGQGFAGTTGVSFNGVAANFTVKSDSFLTARVPAGATTGYVTVATPSGKLKSNVPFHVIR